MELIKEVYNKTAQELFVSSDDHSFNILLTDNDKVHSELSKKTDTIGLKRHRHVKDN